MNELHRVYKTLAAYSTLGVTALLLSTTATAEEVTAEENCSYNTTTPIIPDGNIATKDELIGAKTRIKVYQDNLLDFRECLVDAEKALDVEADDFEVAKAALRERSSQSIDLETKVAAEFNKALNIYKDR